MIYRALAAVLGQYCFYLAAILLIPLGVAFYYDFTEPHQFSSIEGFSKTIALCLVIGLILIAVGGKTMKTLRRKEGILLVVLIWFVTAAIAALPFYVTKVLENPIDAYFESMSGLTTTGASIIHAKAYDDVGVEIPLTINNYTFYGTVAPSGVLKGLEAIGKPLLFWRSFLQWVGGIGIVVLFLAVLPALGHGGKFLYESEATGPSKEGITPRIKETAIFLCSVYCGLTVFQVVLLALTSMPLFDAINLAFTTISTGGFTIHNDGLGSYSSGSIIIITLFMILGSLNFSLYFYLLKRKLYHMTELRWYFITLAAGSLLMFFSLWKQGSQGFFQGSFQAISAQTSTGFVLVNYDAWPFACQLLMIILMYVGGMSGSTAGGIKIVRYIIACRTIYHKMGLFFRPGVVRVLKVGPKEVSEQTSSSVLAFFCLVIFFVIIGTYLLVVDNIDPLTAFGVISTTLNNNGLLVGGVGSMGSFAFLSPFAKVIAILWMLFGRLEFFSLLVLGVPSFWRSR